MTKILGLAVLLALIIVSILLMRQNSNPQYTVTPDDSGQIADANDTTSPIDSIPNTTPTPEAPMATPQTITTKIGQQISMFGATGSVVSVVEDSRCPQDVQCIQAGTVRVQIRASYFGISKNITLTLNEPYTMSGKSITLTDVTPYPISTQSITPSDYTFTFLIK